MCLKVIKWGAVSVLGVGLVGGLLFGRDLASYIGSSAKSVRTAMKDNVPIDFELQRARDLLENIIPEMQANVRLIAHEEVEVAGLEGEIARCSTSLADEKARVARLRNALTTQQVSYTLGGLEYTREQVREELARRFERFKEAELVMAGKQRLLDTRRRSLQAAMQVLDRTRAQKVRLEDQIAALESQYHLVKAASVGSPLHVDNSKLAQTEKLLGDIKKRLDVAERVLAHEARFVQPIEIDVVDEQDLIAQVDDYLNPVGGTRVEIGAVAAREATDGD